MVVFVLVNGRTRAVCGVFSSAAAAGAAAAVVGVDSWHVVERVLDALPVQIA